MAEINKIQGPLYFLDPAVYIEQDVGGNLAFTDGISGTKTLADLLSISGLWSPNGDDIYYSGGNVGIGTDSPIDLTSAYITLTVEGPTGGILQAINPSAVKIGELSIDYVGSRTNNNFNIVAYMSTIATFQPNGNVGIGTVIPQSRLTLKGVSIDSNAFRYNGSTSDNRGFEIGFLGTDDLHINFSRRYSDVPYSFMSIDRSNGFVGLGKTAPTELLHLYSATGSTDIGLEGGATSGQGWRIRNDQAANRFAISSVISSFGTFTERFSILADGNIGIGIASPVKLLHVRENSLSYNDTGAYARFENTLAQRGIELGQTNGFPYIQGYYDNKTQTRDLLLQPEGGNVGIGTTNPQAQMHISSSAPTLRLSNTTLNQTNSGTIEFSEVPSDVNEPRAKIYYDGNSNIFHIATGSGSPTNRISIPRDTGNVGIGGAAHASYRLDVEGIAGGLKVYNSSSTTNSASIEGVQTSDSYNVLQVYSTGNKRFSVGGAGLITAPGIYSRVETSRSVYVDSTGQLGTTSSSRRYKENIKTSALSDNYWKLRPVTFDFKEGKGDNQHGFIAEDVEKLYPEYCDYLGGKVDAVLYQHFTTINTLAIHGLKKTIDIQQKEINSLRSELELIKKHLNI